MSSHTINQIIILIPSSGGTLRVRLDLGKPPLPSAKLINKPMTLYQSIQKTGTNYK